MLKRISLGLEYCFLKGRPRLGFEVVYVESRGVQWSQTGYRAERKSQVWG